MEERGIKAKIIALLVGLGCTALIAQTAPTQEDFTACFKRNLGAYVVIDGYHGVAITHNRAVAFSSGKAPKSYIKYDPFMDLYVLKSKNELFFVPQNEERVLGKGAWLSSIDKDGKINIGKLESLGKNLGEFDNLSTSSPKGTIITGVCCDMYGLGIGDKHFIGNRYLEHIVAYDFVYYGDIGASFGAIEGKIKIVEIDPFVASGLHIGDEITHFGKEPIKDIRTLNEAVLFAPKDSKITLQVTRGKQSLTLELPVRNRPLTSMVTKTYLEPLGMSFDKELRLKSVKNNSKAKSQGLEAGDRLLQIGQIGIKTPKSLRLLLPTLERGVTHHMLFERDEFQFFVTLVLPIL